MPSRKAQKSGEFCPQCGNDTPADKLKLLYAKYQQSEDNPDPSVWFFVGRFCYRDTCLPLYEKIQKEQRQAIELKTEAYVPKTIKVIILEEENKSNQLP